MRIYFAVTGLLLVVWSPTVRAQEPELTGTVSWGPLSLKPRVDLNNIGVDSNVFNEADAPRSDETFNLTTQLETRVRMRRFTLAGTSTIAYNYFHKYDTERSLNPAQSVRLEWAVPRATLRASYGVASTRERPGLEVDLRARRTLTTATAGFDVRLGARTRMQVEGMSTDTDFRSAIFDAVNLRGVLNRQAREARLSLRHARTALTTLVLSGEYLDDRFPFSSGRNAVGWRLMPGVEFGRSALISGRASVGWRRYEPELAQVPNFSGLAARAELSSVIRERLRVEVGTERDVAYSYTADYPYFIQTTASVSATLRIGPRWDAGVRTGRQSLAYRELANSTTAPDPASAPALDGALYGANLNYRLRDNLRIALSGLRSQRRGGIGARSFDSWQAGISIGYGY